MVEVSWLLFIVASLVLIVTPGQDMILVMSRSIADVRRRNARRRRGLPACRKKEESLLFL